MPATAGRSPSLPVPWTRLPTARPEPRKKYLYTSARWIHLAKHHRNQGTPLTINGSAIMLPKVATHILHHTSRAAAAVQNQTTQTIRNVLQFQSSPSPSSSTGTLSGWNGPGSSSSNWGSNGTGPGGAKYNAGSRFHNGYTVCIFFFLFIISIGLCFPREQAVLSRK